ncbi:apolipo L3-like protein [Labeo rohita]|uniref:Apolipo L3-like protein n=1 Tax=Labeo rohita TaxID=84645 RepID=A0A498M7U8_LABRO|nr:apolipo L3-like protein [Labeo rohita]RXN39327.1 apolipo L3-like protein [Labeo rohita]
MGAAGGITSIVGLALAPVTLGVSLALTAVGSVVGVAGGATGTICNIINDTQQKHLRETIEKITSDFQNTINAMFESVSTIINSTEDVQQLVQQEMNHYIPARMIQAGVDKVRRVSAILGLPKPEVPPKSQGTKQFDSIFSPTNIFVKGFQFCSGAVKKINSSLEAVKTFHSTSKAAKKASEAVKAARLSSGVAKTARLSSEATKTARLSTEVAKTARLSSGFTKTACLSSEATKTARLSSEVTKTARLSSEATKTARLSSEVTKTARLSSEATKTTRLSSEVAKTARLSSGAAKTVRMSAQTAKAARSAAAVSGVISALFLVLDVVCIVQNSMELSEMNQSADKRNAKNIRSNTLKFIHQMRETAAHFQKTLDENNNAKDNAIEEFNKELKNSTSFLLRQK